MSGATAWISSFLRANNDARRALIGDEDPAAAVSTAPTPTDDRTETGVAPPSPHGVDTYKLLFSHSE